MITRLLLLNFCVLTRVSVVGERRSPLLLPLHPGPENGHQTAWGRRVRRKGSKADKEVCTEYFSHPGGPSLWHAGTFTLGLSFTHFSGSWVRKLRFLVIIRSLFWGLRVRLSLVSVQVYQMNTGHYLCRNKYYGRGLSTDGFREALHQFLHNGKGLRQDLFEPILNKLRSLKVVLEKQASYRFYSSSLLIIYEGQVRKMDLFINANEGFKLKQNNTIRFLYGHHTVSGMVY